MYSRALLIAVSAVIFAGFLVPNHRLRIVGKTESEQLYGGTCFIPRAASEQYCKRTPTCNRSFWGGNCNGSCDTCPLSPRVYFPLAAGYGHKAPTSILADCPRGTTRPCAGIALPPGNNTCQTMCTVATVPLACGSYTDIKWDYNTSCTGPGSSGGTP